MLLLDGILPEMEVNLGDRDRRVDEDFLQGSDVHAALDHRGGAGVPEQMAT